MSSAQIGFFVLFAIATFGGITFYLDFLHERRRDKRVSDASQARAQSPTRR
ncbi:MULTISPECIES: hypothetical protein [Pseudomonas]|uniref:Uncharacterized protein n=1 Tax=Pseudomonas sessilinigenes TaxID=658629 RepID=A0ABX8MIN0_9PSED|nr:MULTISPECIES: hypothetical protein [Pseudomonas]QXH38019.1 hypothetical protein KSS89_17175 [Pseudomonas sessilinigenes]UMZ10495.1 hypothetical protein I9018_23830 [Pseudomonas sp. MPFS]